MEIEFSKRSDGRAIMRCVRSDGSVAWQRHDGRYASFFPCHDLTHLAVELELGLCKAGGLAFARTFTAAELARVRSRRDELYTRWAELPVDETLNISLMQDSVVRA